MLGNSALAAVTGTGTLIFLLVGFGSLIVAFGMRRADRELRRQERD